MTGQIARLPHSIREEPNRRPHDGETNTGVLPWLNGLFRQYRGREISERNRSEGKSRGYQRWLARQDWVRTVRKLNEEVTEKQRQEEVRELLGTA